MSTESLRMIIYKYSTENIERLWDSFLLQTRKSIVFGERYGGIDINKKFAENSTEGKNAIISLFKHAGVETYIGWNKNNKKFDENAN